MRRRLVIQEQPKLQSSLATIVTGNKRFDAANTTTLGSCTQAVCNPLINTSDNRLKKDQDADSVTDYDYDANGALIRDTKDQRFGYDAESRQTEFVSGSNQTTTPDPTYEYDGDGKRIKKTLGTEVTIFVYDAGGQSRRCSSATASGMKEASI
jgi:YD repeat-containing protein